MPLILGAIILISKKAAFLSKLALFISGFFGLGSIATLGGIGNYGYGGGVYHGGYGYQDPIHHQHLSGVYKVLDSNTPPRSQQEEEIVVDHFYDYDKKHLLKDRSSRLYEREVDQGNNFNYKPSNQRTFVWAPSIANN